MDNKYTLEIIFLRGTPYKYNFTTLEEAAEAYDFARSPVGVSRYPSMVAVQLRKNGTPLASTTV